MTGNSCEVVGSVFSWRTRIQEPTDSKLPDVVGTGGVCVPFVIRRARRQEPARRGAAS